MKKTFHLPFVLLILSLSACSTLEGAKNEDISALPPTTQTGSINEPSPTPSTPRPQTLQLWLPSEFDPEASNPAAALLKERLATFSERHPGVRFDIRLKPGSGPGGLLEFLTAASAAAPASLPDLVLFSRPDLEAAAQRNLVHPLDNLWEDRQDPDWYDFALELASVSSQIFGLPFAADALVLTYDSLAIATPPRSWEAAVQAGNTIAFPAADLQALITSSYYLHQIKANDAASEQTLDMAALASVLDYYSKGHEAGIFPIWITQLEDDLSTWNSLLAGQVSMCTTWTSTFFTASQTNIAASLIPTSDGSSFSPMRGWIWALGGSNLNRQSLALELAQYLTESDFLGAWTEAAGYIPPRAGALTIWPEGIKKSIASQAIAAAHIIPPLNFTELLGGILSPLTIEVIKGNLDANTAAQSAVNALQDD